MILWVVGVLLAEKFYGGPHVVLSGESHGFKIGMAKVAVLEKYRDLNETANIRAYGVDGVERLAPTSRPAELKMTPEFEASDHWMAYRQKWPVYFQEFYFADGKLVSITTYIRFYETP
jgi:hypothetical protein